MALRALGERPFGPAPAIDDRLQARLMLRALGAHLCHALLGPGELVAPGPRGVARQLEAHVEHLALETLVQLRRLGLALERSQPGPRLALHVERAVDVLLRALELQLRAASALAVLAQPRGLLDQQSPVAGLRGHDRLDPPLRDDGVHLLAQPGVGEHLDHVAQPAAGTVQPVATLPRTVQAPHDRYLAQRQLERPVGVVQHDLHLGGAASLHSPPAAEDHVLHRLAANGQRRLLAQPPEDRVGDVGLARPVWTDHHADPRAEVQLGAVRERLEAGQRKRLQAHAVSSPALVSRATSPPVPPPPRGRPPARRASCSCRSLFRAPGRPPAQPPRRCARAAVRPPARSRS